MIPFSVQISDQQIENLKARVRNARWIDQPAESNWDSGVPVSHVQQLAEYWYSQYDWKRVEKRLNAWPQYRDVFDEQPIHYYWARSKCPNAFPLILTHGWPGTVVEWLDIVAPLVAPDGSLDATAPAFDLVIPSLPGFGFSTPLVGNHWNTERIAATWTELMKRLGYERYGAVGNDWGSIVSPKLARYAPDAVAAVLVNQVFSLPNGEPQDWENLNEDDQASLDGWKWFQRTFGSYHTLQAQQPQTLAHALNDSPVGLLAWLCQIFRGEVDPEFAITSASLLWHTRSIGSSLRIYHAEDKQTATAEPTLVPLGLARFGHDGPAIRKFAERDHENIVYWKSHDTGGHFAARQVPDLLIGDIRAFFRPFVDSGGTDRRHR